MAMPTRSRTTTEEAEHGTQEADAYSPWRNLARGVLEATRAFAVPDRAGLECSSSPDQRDRARKARYYRRHGAPTRPILRHLSPVLAEPPGAIAPGGRERSAGPTPAE